MSYGAAMRYENDNLIVQYDNHQRMYILFTVGPRPFNRSIVLLRFNTHSLYACSKFIQFCSTPRASFRIISTFFAYSSPRVPWDRQPFPTSILVDVVEERSPKGIES